MGNGGGRRHAGPSHMAGPSTVRGANAAARLKQYPWPYSERLWAVFRGTNPAASLKPVSVGAGAIWAFGRRA
jgi:hypothetical protein